MGSTVSVCNNTTCILNVAMKHITPLYFENELRPGDCMQRDVGKVWFTLEARLWNGENGYETLSDIVFPITMLTLTAFALVVGSFAGASLIAALAGSITGRVLTIGKVVLAAGASQAAKSMVGEWVGRAVLREHGLYMGADRTFLVSGGPNCLLTDGFQIVRYLPGDTFTLDYLQ